MVGNRSKLQESGREDEREDDQCGLKGGYV